MDDSFSPDTDPSSWHVEIVTPVLLDEARRSYGSAIRGALAAAGFDDVPRLGPRVLGGITLDGSGLSDFTAVLGRSKQTASQLIDTLVTRGYLDRAPDPDDRRRLIVTLTDRGAAAAEICNEAIASIEQRITAEVGADEFAATRAVLARLAEIGQRRSGE